MPPPLAIVLAAILFSTGGAAIKACSLSSWQVAGFRSALAAAVLLLAMPSARTGWSRRAALVAVVYSSTMILFVTANKLTTSMNTIFLQNTSPLYILLLSPVLLGEPIRPRDLGYMGLILAGLAMFFVGSEAPQGTSPNPVAGNVVALLSGVAWALTIIGLRWLGRGGGQPGGAMPAVIMGNLITFVACLPMAVPVHGAGMRDWLVIAFLGVFQVGLAYVFLTRGLAAVPAFVASILLLIEPVVNPVWAFLIHGEVPSAWAVAGAVMILSATFLKSWNAEPSGSATEPARA